MLDDVLEKERVGTGRPDTVARSGNPPKFHVILHSEARRYQRCKTTILMEVFNMNRFTAGKKAMASAVNGYTIVLEGVSLDVAETKMWQAEERRLLHRGHNAMAEFFGFIVKPADP